MVKICALLQPRRKDRPRSLVKPVIVGIDVFRQLPPIVARYSMPNPALKSLSLQQRLAAACVRVEPTRVFKRESSEAGGGGSATAVNISTLRESKLRVKSSALHVFFRRAAKLVVEEAHRSVHRIREPCNAGMRRSDSTYDSTETAVS